MEFSLYGFRVRLRVYETFLGLRGARPLQGVCERTVGEIWVQGSLKQKPSKRGARDPESRTDREDACLEAREMLQQEATCTMRVWRRSQAAVLGQHNT